MPLFLRPSRLNTPEYWDVWSGRPDVAPMRDVSLSMLHDARAGWGEESLALLVPVRHVLCTRLEISAQQYRQARQGVAFLLEEWLSDDLDHMHCIVGRRDPQGHVIVLAIQKDWLERALEALAASGIVPDLVLIDAYVLPEPRPEVLGVWQVGSDLLLRWHGQQVGGCDAEGRDFLELEVTRQHLQLEEHELDWQQVLQAVRWSELQGLGLNFLQGPFKPKSGAGGIPAQWRPVLALLAVAVFVVLLNQLSMIVRERSEQRLLEQQVEQSYRTLFPDEQRIVNLRVQIESHLDVLPGSKQGTIRHLADLARTAHDTGVPAPQHLAYQSGHGFDLDVGTDVDHANRWVAALQSGGYQVQSSTNGNLQHLHIEWSK